MHLKSTAKRRCKDFGNPCVLDRFSHDRVRHNHGKSSETLNFCGGFPRCLQHPICSKNGKSSETLSFYGGFPRCLVWVVEKEEVKNVRKPLFSDRYGQDRQEIVLKKNVRKPLVFDRFQANRHQKIRCEIFGNP